MKELKEFSIIVYQRLAYNGGLASKRILLWHYLLIGKNRKTMYPEGDGWEGHPDKKHAKRNAYIWGKFLGWPVVDLGRTKMFDDKIKPGHVE